MNYRLTHPARKGSIEVAGETVHEYLSQGWKLPKGVDAPARSTVMAPPVTVTGGSGPGVRSAGAAKKSAAKKSAAPRKRTASKRAAAKKSAPAPGSSSTPTA